MKKIFIIVICFSLCMKVHAIELIEIDNEPLIPSFSKDIKKYNYYTSKDKIEVIVTGENEGSGIYELQEGLNIIKVSDQNNEYKISVFKNYKKNSDEETKLLNLTIKGYNIKFDSDIYEYNISINDEDYLDINYELSNDNSYVSVSGNGNFNKSKNEIIININNERYYKINAYKTLSVSKVESTPKYVELTESKKEIVILTIITISCGLVFLFFYSLFINKTILRI